MAQQDLVILGAQLWLRIVFGAETHYTYDARRPLLSDASFFFIGLGGCLRDIPSFRQGLHLVHLLITL